jgi:cytochrome c-type biogenesis protein CcmH/NrfG
VVSFAEDRVAVLSEEHLAGLGSLQWFDAARPQIETLLKMKTDGKEKKSGAFVEEDDLDEM